VSEQRLWAPWRLEYIKGPKPDECIFCAKPAQGDDKAAYIVARGERSFVMLNAFPYNNGHVMVAPYRHVAALEELDDATALELMQLTQRCLHALRDAYAPEGFNVGVNQGKVAGAGVADHVHLHVVPRWGADTNFMPVIGSTRVLPQSLEGSYAELARRMRAGALE
jgi:ATP adenylyltransferase